MRLKRVLKTLILAILALSLPAFAELREVCGAYQMEDYGDRVIYTLTDFSKIPKMPTYYSIQNPAVETSLTLLRGACYCVKGDVRSDFEFLGDPSYKIIQLESLTGPPTFDCWPN